MIESAKNLLRTIRQRTDAIGVAFSGGKDAHVTLDLCREIFPRVEAFYLYRVPGLGVIDRICKRAERRYGITVAHYPHFDLTRCFRFAVLQPHWTALDKVPTLKMADIEAAFRRDKGIEWIAYGWRRSDSRSRAIILSTTRGLDEKAKRVFPLRIWRRADVIAYLRAKRIPVPPGFGREEQGGVDFHAKTVEYLRDKWPEDFQKLLTHFPYAQAQTIRPAH